jgi:hypothetical protein
MDQSPQESDGSDDENMEGEEHDHSAEGDSESAEAAGVDTSDYIAVDVNVNALIDISTNWIGSPLLSSGANGAGENLLLFLLMMPYVDEGWGIHDAVLVST